MVRKAAETLLYFAWSQGLVEETRNTLRQEERAKGGREGNMKEGGGAPLKTIATDQPEIGEVLAVSRN